MKRAQKATMLAFIVLLLVVDLSEGLKIGSFYVNTLGASKMSNDTLVDIIVKVIRKYDVVLIQGIRDVGGETVLPKLITAVNNGSECTYAYVASQPLGKGKQRETFAFFYKVDNVELIATHEHDDQDDSFYRDPFSILISPRAKTAEEVYMFFLLGVHLRSSDVCDELGALHEAYQNASTIFNDTDGLILGNFNSDCCYLRGCPFPDLAIAQDPFKWLIDFSTDTTTTDTFCAYDRIVAGGSTRKHIVPNSAQVNRIDKCLGLSPEEMQAVSGHYPISVNITNKARSLETFVLVVTKSTRAHSHSKGPHILSMTANGNTHNITLQDKSNLPDVFRYDLKDDFGFTGCLQPKDIERICIIPASTDAWIFSSVTSFAYDCFNDVTFLTNDHKIDISVDEDNRGNGAIMCLTKIK